MANMPVLLPFTLVIFLKMAEQTQPVFGTEAVFGIVAVCVKGPYSP